MGEPHELSPAEQLRYPGGKDGYWVVRCACGYTTGARDSAGKAQQSAQDHLGASEQH